MAEAARARGYAYLAITDHSASHGFGNHVTDAQLAERIAEVAKWNESPPRGFRLLAGSEVNIGTDGGLDYPDDLLAELDWVMASVHTSLSRQGHDGARDRSHREPARGLHRPPHRQVDRQTRALRHRRRGGRRGRGRGPAHVLEINGNPNRRDLSEHHARLASEAGVMICVNTDAHGTDTLSNMIYGVATARRAWLTAGNVANTRGWAAFKKLRKKR